MNKFCTGFLFLLFCIPLYSAKESSTKESNDCCFRIWEKHNPSWYIGVGGFVNDSLSGKSFSVVTAKTGNVGAINAITYDTSHPAIGFQGLIGYNFNKVTAFEFKYLQTVWPDKFFVRNIDKPDDPFLLNHQLDFKIYQIAFGPSTLLAFPISSYFAPYFKGGFYIFHYHRKKTYDSKFNQPTTKTLETNFWNARFILGYGIRSQLTKHFGLRLEYECTVNPIIDTLGKITQGNIGLISYFIF
ncbi:MAG: porin family protein [Chlamydiae bacterium]|nr:porin family protein [Chlamydiota bacterium]